MFTKETQNTTILAYFNKVYLSKPKYTHFFILTIFVSFYVLFYFYYVDLKDKYMTNFSILNFNYEKGHNKHVFPEFKIEEKFLFIGILFC